MTKSITFDALVAGFALRACLTSLSSFVLIASSANWECTFVAGSKRLPIDGNFNLIVTNPANLPSYFLHRCHLLYTHQSM